jgi:hypothetical protein
MGLLVLLFCPCADRAEAAATIFLQDGRTIQADKVEIIGDTLRIHKPTETIDLPRSRILSIHPTEPPSGSAATTSPAEVYRSLGQQMNDKVRREIESRPGAPGAK